MRVPIIVGWFLVLVACTEREQAASTQRMAELLEDIAVNVDPATHPYVNLDRVAYFRAQLDHLRQADVATNPRGESKSYKPDFLLPTNCCKPANPSKQCGNTGNCRLWPTILGFGILSNY